MALSGVPPLSKDPDDALENLAPTSRLLGGGGQASESSEDVRCPLARF